MAVAEGTGVGTIIDETYKFSAPRFFDFTKGESDEDVRRAELWFHTSPNSWRDPSSQSDIPRGLDFIMLRGHDSSNPNSGAGSKGSSWMTICSWIIQSLHSKSFWHASQLPRAVTSAFMLCQCCVRSYCSCSTNRFKKDSKHECYNELNLCNRYTPQLQCLRVQDLA